MENSPAAAYFVFCPSALLRLGLAIGMLAPIPLAWLLWHQPDGYLLAPILLLLTVYCYLAWPRRIFASDTELRQRTPWGTMKRIAYDDVLSITASHRKRRSLLGLLSEPQSIVIVDNGKTRIFHTPHHGDQRLFRELLTQRVQREAWSGIWPEGSQVLN